MAKPTLPTGLVGGEAGLVSWVNALNAFHNTHRTYEVPAGASQADIATALADAHTAGGGDVKLMGNTYTASATAGNAAFEITLPTVRFDLGGSTITFTGAGECIRVQPTPFTVEQGAQVRNGKIDGGGASNGATGIRLVDATAVVLADLIVDSFDGVGSTNLTLETTSVHNQTERTLIMGVHLNNGTVDLRIKGSGTGLPSFARTMCVDLMMNSVSGQTTVLIEGGAYLYDSYLGLRGNVAAGCILVDCVSGGAQHNRLDFGFETSGACTRFKMHATNFGAFEGSGQVSCVGGFTDNISTNTKRLLLRGGDAINQQVTPHDAVGALGVAGPVANTYPMLIDNIDDPIAAFGVLVGADIRSMYAVAYAGNAGNGFVVYKRFAGGALDEVWHFNVDGGMTILNDTALYRESAGVLKTLGCFKTGTDVTASRPSAATAGFAAQWFDATLQKPIWSNGTVWKDAMGNTV